MLAPTRYSTMLTEGAATSGGCAFMRRSVDPDLLADPPVSSPLNRLRRDTSLTTPLSSQESRCCAALTFPPLGLAGRRQIILVSSAQRIVRPREVRRSIDVVSVRLVRRECVEVVSAAAPEEPGEESLPVAEFLAETPEAHPGRFMPDRRVAPIERAVLA
jgi:hypothetical protein